MTKEEVPPEVRAVMEAGERTFGEALLSHGVQAYGPLRVSEH